MSNNYLMLFPNKTEPQGIRMQIKAINIQKYFMYKEYGGPENARKAANEALEIAEKQLKAKRLRKDLPINKFFSEGLVTQIKVHKRKSRGRRYLCLVLVAYEHQKRSLHFERSLTVHDFDTAFKELTGILFTHYNVDMTSEIKSMLKKARMNYLRKLHSMA